MPDAVPPALDAYAEQHTTPPPEHLARLDADTRTELGHDSMLSGFVVGRLLQTLVELQRPRLVVEVGTFSGGSALWMARGLGEGARIVTCELDAEHAAFARARIDAAGEAGRVEVVLAPALETIAGLDEPIDFAFVDAEKEGYSGYLDALLEQLSPDGTVVADNTLRDGGVLSPPEEQSAGTRAIVAFNERVARDPALSATFLTVRDGLTIIRRA